MKENWLLKKLIEKRKRKINTLDKILFSILALGMLLIFVLFAYLLWFLITNKSIIYFLPSQKTVAYFELEDLTLPPKLPQDNLFGLTGVSAILKNSFGLEINDLKDKLTQGRMGLALVKADNDDNKILLFFRPRGKSGTVKFFESLGISGEKLTVTDTGSGKIYSYPQSRNFSFAFVGPYLFLSQDAEVLKLIQSVNKKTVPSLHEDAQYQKSLSNLPRDAWGNGYLNIQLVHFASNNSLNQISEPLKTIINHIAISIRKQQNGFHFNTLMSINQTLLSLNKGKKESPGFAYSLSDYIGSKNIVSYFGGANLGDELQNTLATMSNINPAYGLILEGILNAQLNKTVGDNVSLRDDIYPLLNGEYAMIFEKSPATPETPAKPVYKLIIKNSDANFAKVKLEKIMDGFKMLASQFAPKLKVVPLPDGTESKELVADPTKLDTSTESYKNYDINCTLIINSSFGLCYTVTDSLIVISNSLESVKETVDLSLSPKFVLSQSQPFRQALSNLSSISDEITYISLANAEELLKGTNAGLITADLLSPFEAITWIKHYFTDGMSAEGYLLLK